MPFMWCHVSQGMLDFLTFLGDTQRTKILHTH